MGRRIARLPATAATLAAGSAGAATAKRSSVGKLPDARVSPR